MVKNIIIISRVLCAQNFFQSCFFTFPVWGILCAPDESDDSTLTNSVDSFRSLWSLACTHRRLPKPPDFPSWSSHTMRWSVWTSRTEMRSPRDIRWLRRAQSQRWWRNRQLHTSCQLVSSTLQTLRERHGPSWGRQCCEDTVNEKDKEKLKKWTWKLK